MALSGGLDEGVKSKTNKNNDDVLGWMDNTASKTDVPYLSLQRYLYAIRFLGRLVWTYRKVQSIHYSRGRHGSFVTIKQQVRTNRP